VLLPSTTFVEALGVIATHPPTTQVFEWREQVLKNSRHPRPETRVAARLHHLLKMCTVLDVLEQIFPQKTLAYLP